MLFGHHVLELFPSRPVRMSKDLPSMRVTKKLKPADRSGSAEQTTPSALKISDIGSTAVNISFIDQEPSLRMSWCVFFCG